jgi:hypothetical protein
MPRTCARPTCAEPAQATLDYDYANRTVWLSSLTGEATPRAHDLCDRHADSLSVPRGWVLHDDRENAAGMFAPSEVASTLPVRRAAPA